MSVTSETAKSHALPKEGQRVRLLAMPDDPHPVPIGTLGTVMGVNPAYGSMTAQIMMKWDSGSTLAMIDGIDRWEIVT